MRKEKGRLQTTRRVFCQTLTVIALSNFLGCSLFKGSTKKETLDDFDEEEEAGDSKSVFDTERDKQADLSEYVAQTGRSSKSKKKVSSGDTFLMSDKAKEIYANTER